MFSRTVSLFEEGGAICGMIRGTGILYTIYSISFVPLNQSSTYLEKDMAS